MPNMTTIPTAPITVPTTPIAVPIVRIVVPIAVIVVAVIVVVVVAVVLGILYKYGYLVSLFAHYESESEQSKPHTLQLLYVMTSYTLNPQCRRSPI